MKLSTEFFNKVRLGLICLVLLSYVSLSAQDSGNSSCEAGGEMWVCGTEQIVQATSDFDTNCEEWIYAPCTLLRVVIDICRPDMLETKIYEPGGSDCEFGSSQQ